MIKLCIFLLHVRSSDACGGCSFCVFLLYQEISLIDRCVSTYIARAINNPDHISTDEGDRPSPGENEVNVEMQKCGAYEAVRFSRQRVTMRDNPAYVDIALT